jgi:hypothetical protein
MLQALLYLSPGITVEGAADHTKIFFSYHAIRPVQTQCFRESLEQMLKDYNGQTYWLSVNLHSFYKGSKIPKWLNLAIGYGANGMLTGNGENNGLF